MSVDRDCDDAVDSWLIVAQPKHEHAHPHEQVTTCLSGEFELTVDGSVHRLAAGQSMVIAGGARHSGRAIVACKMLDVFQPPRDDYR